MTNPLRAAWDWMRDDHVLFSTSPGVGRVFMRCVECQRVRPAYRLLMKAGSYKRMFCKCGSKYQRPSNLPWWLAAWWLLIVGVVWRKTLLRTPDWDPRLPLRKES